jgi:deoxyadenosine/deoxycytidine kinase
MNNKTLITITANIAAGKSTLLTELEKYVDANNVVILKEPLDKWQNKMMKNGKSIFENFCSNTSKWAFEFEMFVYETRIEQLKTAIESNPNAQVFILERSPDDDRFIFSQMFYEQGHISTDELVMMDKYRNEWVDVYKPMVKHIIHLYTSPLTCWNRKQSRARVEEDALPVVYFETIDYYTNLWLKKQDELVVNVDNECSNDCRDHRTCTQFKDIILRICKIINC